MMIIKIFSRRNWRGKNLWYFRVVSKVNGQTVAQSQGYSRRIDAETTAQSLKSHMPNAKMIYSA